MPHDCIGGSGVQLNIKSDVFLLKFSADQWIAGKENFTLEKTFLQSSHEIFVLHLYLYKINDPNQPGLASKFLTLLTCYLMRVLVVL